jgi:hypothetical protein
MQSEQVATTEAQCAVTAEESGGTPRNTGYNRNAQKTKHYNNPLCPPPAAQIELHMLVVLCLAWSKFESHGSCSHIWGKAKKEPKTDVLHKTKKPNSDVLRKTKKT